MQLPGFDGSSDAVLRFQDGISVSLARTRLHLLVGAAGSGKTHAAQCLSAFHKAVPVSVTGRETLATGLAQPATGYVLIEEIGLQPPCVQKGLRDWIGLATHTQGPRVICTSSWTPERLMQTGRLDAPLAAQLDPWAIAVPTLHDRLADLAVLCACWSAEDDSYYTLDEQSLLWLAHQKWPGNLRQLRQTLKQVACLAPGGHVMPMHLADMHQSEAHQSDTTTNAASFQDLMARYLPSLFDLETDIQGTLHARVLSEVERPLFSLVLQATDGNQIRAAALLGINRNTLRKKLTLLGIDAGAFRS